MKKLIVVASALCLSFNANAVCKGSTALKGNFPFTIQYVGHNDGAPVGCGAVGYLQFDGKGGTTLVQESGCYGYLSNGGKFEKGSGTYTLDTDCSGKATFSAGTEEEIIMMYVFDNALSKATLLFNGANAITGSGTLFKQ